jgi:hypothetical protein
LSTTNWIEGNSQQPKTSSEQYGKESAKAQMPFKYGLLTACVTLFEFHWVLLWCFSPNAAVNLPTPSFLPSIHAPVAAVPEYGQIKRWCLFDIPLSP